MSTPRKLKQGTNLIQTLEFKTGLQYSAILHLGFFTKRFFYGAIQIRYYGMEHHRCGFEGYDVVI